METKNLEALKQFFTISIAGFNFVETTLKTIGQSTTYKQIEMKKLHQEALDLLEKTDLTNIENAITTQVQLGILINQMELLTTQMNVPVGFKEGGVHSSLNSGKEILIKRDSIRNFDTKE